MVLCQSWLVFLCFLVHCTRFLLVIGGAFAIFSIALSTLSSILTRRSFSRTGLSWSLLICASSALICSLLGFLSVIVPELYSTRNRMIG
mgnify:CR=1 FL=1